ncbi:MAG: 30S ribosome-binding factor RbfA [Candidatus Adiutrix sp.]|jgi:ribosome-binding factor A|nr:30S ribosome-binding factor RbfA [Candidatus Adiutrix sp.]
MTRRRLEKMSELIRETVAELLLSKSKDPRLREVNVTGVRVTADLKKAVVRYSVLGGEEAKTSAAKTLGKAAGYVRAALGETLNLKYVPEIEFEFDRNLEYAQQMNELLNSLSGPSQDSEAAAGEDRKDD